MKWTVVLLAITILGCAQPPKQKTRIKRVVVVKKDDAAITRALIKALRDE